MQDIKETKTATPLVSFVLTYYNLTPELLRTCIDSIRALTLRASEREIIVVDDGSKQSPLDSLGDYQDEIIYVRQRNGGLSAARNTGVRLATGQYLQFVDADDQLLTAAYEHCLDIVRYQKVDMVLFGLTDSSPSKPLAYDDQPMTSGCELMRHHNIKGSACSYVFRKQILGDLHFTPGIYHEDEEFTPLLLLRADSVVSTSANAYLYQKRQDSITTSTNLRQRLKRLNDAQQVLFRLQRIADTLPADARLALRRRVHQLTMDYIYNVIRETRSRRYLNRKLDELSALGIYPLPKRDYTQKYKWFRRLANSNMGLSVLLAAIPILSKEQ